MWRLLAIPLFVLLVVVHTAAHAQYYPYPPPYYAPGYYPPAYYPPAYYRPPPPPPPPAAYMYRGGLPYYGAPLPTVRRTRDPGSVQALLPLAR